MELGGHTEDQLRVIKKRIIHKINTAKQVGILAKSLHISLNYDHVTYQMHNS